MKKLLNLLLAASLALSLAACGGNGDKHDYSTNLIGVLNISSLTLTEEDVIALEDGFDYEVDEGADSRILYFEDGHVYRFSTKDGSLEFVKWTIPDFFKELGMSDEWEETIDGAMEDWTKTYGEPEYNDNMSSYYWYGNIGGVNAKLIVLRSKLGNSMLELDRVV